MLPVFGIVATATAVVGVAAVITVSVIPAVSEPTQPVWMDAPIAGEIWAASEHSISLHAAADAAVTQFRVTITKNGSPDGTRNTANPDNQKRDTDQVLATGSVDWTPEGGGAYVLTPSFLSGGHWTVGGDVPITVSDDPDYSPPVGVTVPGITPTPGTTASAAPTAPAATPTAAPTTAPVAPQPPVTTTPTPTPTPTKPPQGVSSGRVTHTATNSNDTLTATGFLPATASVDIQIQIQYNGAAVAPTGWVSEGCSNTTQTIAGSTCSVTLTVPQAHESQTVYFRDVVTSGSSTGTGIGGSWVIPAEIG